MSKKIAAVAIAGLAAAGLVAYDKISTGSWLWEKPPFVSTQKLSTQQLVKMQVQAELSRRDAERRRKEDAVPTGKYAAVQNWKQTGQRW